MDKIEELHKQMEQQVHIIRENQSRLTKCYGDKRLDPVVSFDKIDAACKEIKKLNHQLKSALGSNKEKRTRYSNENDFYLK